MTAHELKPGDAVTTRYYGGYERVKVVQSHDSYLIVSRFSGAATDILPKDQIEKMFAAHGDGESALPEAK